MNYQPKHTVISSMLRFHFNEEPYRTDASISQGAALSSGGSRGRGGPVPRRPPPPSSS